MDFLNQENKKYKKPYGGELLKTRKGRSIGRPLDTKSTMHLVLRSSKAKGDWSFKKIANEKKIEIVIKKFSLKYGVKIISLANVGNHLHFQIKLSNRYAYAPFIKAITSAIAMAVTGVNRWKRYKADLNSATIDGAKANKEEICHTKLKFWDYRPFTRIVKSFKAYLNLSDYIQINRIEGFGFRKNEARFIWGMAKDRHPLIGFG